MTYFPGVLTRIVSDINVADIQDLVHGRTTGGILCGWKLTVINGTSSIAKVQSEHSGKSSKDGTSTTLLLPTFCTSFFLAVLKLSIFLSARKIPAEGQLGGQLLAETIGHKAWGDLGRQCRSPPSSPSFCPVFISFREAEHLVQS